MRRIAVCRDQFLARAAPSNDSNQSAPGDLIASTERPVLAACAKLPLSALHLRGRSGISGMEGSMGKSGFATGAFAGRRSAAAAAIGRQS
jgi:hypothetical protein